MNNQFQKICVVGLGYIGLPTAAIIAKNQLEVLGVDINKDVIEIINQGKIHIVEPYLEDLVKNVVANKYLKASLSVEKSDVFIIAVPTPFKENYLPDISFVQDATDSIIPVLKEGDLFILESTSPIGTTEKMADRIFLKRPELKNKIYIAYCPERVLPGNVINELENNDRVIGGINQESSIKAASFYSKFVKSNLYKTNARTAEMCKLTENSSRDVQIAFANELSIICDKADINVWELINLANKHPRVKILQPGTGVGGHCIAVDPWFIVSNFPEHSKIIRSAREINNFKTLWVIEKIKNSILNYTLEHGKKPKVALMGLAFKPDIDDLRESPSVLVLNSLHNNSNAEFLIVEPNVTKYKDIKLTNFSKAYTEADIVVFLVGHKEFKAIGQNQVKLELDFCGIRNNY